MNRFFAIIIVSLLLFSCKPHRGEADNPAVAKVGNNVLLKDEVTANLPSNLSPEDSLIMANHYIRTWIDNVLLYAVASDNIDNMEEIDRLTEEYRRSLVVYRYQEQLVNEKMPKNVDEQKLHDFYDRNSDMFILDRPLFKGLMLTVPDNSPNIEYLRYWCRALNVSRKKIEAYCAKNKDVTAYFIDDWTDAAAFARESWPIEGDDLQTLVKTSKLVERREPKYYCFLAVSDVLEPGETAPFEYAKEAVRSVVFNQQKIDFLKKTQDDLYKRASSRGEIEIFNE
ncbi:MAG: hypothetical protein LBR64_02140 [Dysgonamonadaceae bacterium]|jgi:hypothetical protein|nr:hypothetical protein [Dysgonamonadaceae bacterium]